jgi:hypothetical protein
MRAQKMRHHQSVRLGSGRWMWYCRPQGMGYVEEQPALGERFG